MAYICMIRVTDVGRVFEHDVLSGHGKVLFKDMLNV